MTTGEVDWIGVFTDEDVGCHTRISKVPGVTVLGVAVTHMFVAVEPLSIPATTLDTVPNPLATPFITPVTESAPLDIWEPWSATGA